VGRQLGLSESAGREAAAATSALVRARPRPNLHYIADLFDGEARSVYVDSCHLLPEGNRMVGERIYEALEAGAR
jgi:hypothetical protein